MIMNFWANKRAFEDAQWSVRKVKKMQPMWFCLKLVDSESVWKRTVEKIQTNATNGMIHYLEQAILEGIWKRTVEEKKICIFWGICFLKEF